MIARFFGRIRSGVRSFLGLFAFVLWPRPAELLPESGQWWWCAGCGHAPHPAGGCIVAARFVDLTGAIAEVRCPCDVARPTPAPCEHTDSIPAEAEGIACPRCGWTNTPFKEEPMKKKPKKAPKRKTTKRARKGKSRSAVTGRYVSKATARRKPRETVTERE